MEVIPEIQESEIRLPALANPASVETDLPLGSRTRPPLPRMLPGWPVACRLRGDDL